MSYLHNPLKTGILSLSNRLVMPPMATAKAMADGKVSQDLLDYYQEKSAGGYISLIIIEHSYVHPFYFNGRYNKTSCRRKAIS